MAAKTDLAKVILEESSKLFQQQGYAATSIKQIAQAAGCTTAALYYYFKGGKQEILEEVIRSFPGGAERLESMGDCGSVPEFIEELATTLGPSLPEIGDQIGWILLQINTMPDEVKELFHTRLMSTQQAIQERVVCIVEDADEAEKLAWLIFSAFVGYQQIFFKSQINEKVNFGVEEYGKYLASMIQHKVD